MEIEAIICSQNAPKGNVDNGLPETERDLARWFEDLLRLRGWRWYHSRPAFERGRYRTALSGDPGFPDYVCARAGRVLFVELKSERGRRTKEQIAWAAELDGAGGESHTPYGAEYYVWRPSDRTMIMRVLA